MFESEISYLKPSNQKISRDFHHKCQKVLKHLLGENIFSQESLPAKEKRLQHEKSMFLYHFIPQNMHCSYITIQPVHYAPRKIVTVAPKKNKITSASLYIYN